MGTKWAAKEDGCRSRGAHRSCALCLYRHLLVFPRGASSACITTASSYLYAETEDPSSSWLPGATQWGDLHGGGAGRGGQPAASVGGGVHKIYGQHGPGSPPQLSCVAWLWIEGEDSPRLTVAKQTGCVNNVQKLSATSWEWHKLHGRGAVYAASQVPSPTHTILSIFPLTLPGEGNAKGPCLPERLYPIPESNPGVSWGADPTE